MLDKFATYVKASWVKEPFPVYLNPTKYELKDIGEFVRFVIIKKGSVRDVYIWNGKIIHDTVFKDLGFPTWSETSYEWNAKSLKFYSYAFLGHGEIEPGSVEIRNIRSDAVELLQRTPESPYKEILDSLKRQYWQTPYTSDREIHTLLRKE